MRLIAFILVVLTVTVPASAQQSAPRSEAYIADDLIVYLHTGAGRNYRIIGSIEAGLPVTVLKRSDDESFTQIQDAEDRVGWVETQYLINSLSRRAQLPILSQRLADSEQQLSALSESHRQLEQRLASSEQRAAQLAADNAQAQQQILQLNEKLKSQDSAELYRMFSYGGIVAGAGVLLGIIVTFIPKRRRRSDTWM